MSNSLDVDQDECSVGPDLEPKCLQRLNQQTTNFKIIFFKKSFRNAIRVLNSLDPDQDRHSVSPDLDPNCLL